jgi:hypothetical protein
MSPPAASNQRPTRRQNMKTFVIAFTALVFVNGAFLGSAEASQPEFNLVEVEMTPIAEAQKPILVAAERFARYELENIASGGQ